MHDDESREDLQSPVLSVHVHSDHTTSRNYAEIAPSPFSGPPLDYPLIAGGLIPQALLTRLF